MQSHMKARLICTDNSRSIRIPRPLIEQCGLGDEVEPRVENECLIIYPPRKSRAGWEQQFHAAGPSSHDELLLETGENKVDRKKWLW